MLTLCWELLSIHAKPIQSYGLFIHLNRQRIANQQSDSYEGHSRTILSLPPETKKRPSWEKSIAPRTWQSDKFSTVKHFYWVNRQSDCRRFKLKVQVEGSSFGEIKRLVWLSIALAALMSFFSRSVRWWLNNLANWNCVYNRFSK